DVEAERLPFANEQLATVPRLALDVVARRRRRQRVRGRRGRGIEEAEEGRLPRRAIAAGGARALERDVDRREGARPRHAPFAERQVERPALNESLEDGLVDALGVDASAEVEQVPERTGLARLEHRLERRPTQAADGAEPEADLRTERVLRALHAPPQLLVALRVRVDDLEVGVALVDVGR